MPFYFQPTSGAVTSTGKTSCQLRGLPVSGAQHDGASETFEHSLRANPYKAGQKTAWLPMGFIFMADAGKVSATGKVWDSRTSSTAWPQESHYTRVGFRFCRCYLHGAERRDTHAGPSEHFADRWRRTSVALLSLYQQQHFDTLCAMLLARIRPGFPAFLPAILFVQTVLAQTVLFGQTDLFAQTDPAVQAARRYRQAHEREIVSSYLELLSIPNVAADPANGATRKRLRRHFIGGE